MGINYDDASDVYGYTPPRSHGIAIARIEPICGGDGHSGKPSGECLPTAKNGCRWHPDCFTCPFPDCILTDNAYQRQKPRALRRLENGCGQDGRQKAVELSRGGADIKELAQRFHRHPRTISRWVNGK